MPKRIAILGSTGSIGTRVLEVIEALGPEYQVTGLAASTNIRELAAQTQRFKPRFVCAFEPGSSRELAPLIPSGTRILPPGVEGLVELAAHPETDLVFTCLVGSVGLAPLLAAIKAGKTVAVSNKEPLVMAGPVLLREAERWEATILPVDSEPSAVFQCLMGAAWTGGRGTRLPALSRLGRQVRKILLTASGGPFYGRKGPLDGVSIRETLAHPRWKMGPKVTVDSATLMNKGLEAIEIQNLFSLDAGQVEVVIHPQSILHSAVMLADGSVLGQMSPPDMRLPIQVALTFPDRVRGSLPPLDLLRVGRLDFDRPDSERFPCLGLAMQAARVGGSLPAVLSAADEVAVQAFLAGRLRFTDIPRVIERTMACHAPIGSPGLADIVEVDQWARQKAQELVDGGLSRRRLNRFRKTGRSVKTGTVPFHTAQGKNK